MMPLIAPIGGRGGPRLSDRTRDRVVGAVALQTGVAAAAILGQGRARIYSMPRQEVMYRLRWLGYSFPEIARALGLLDHTTIIHGVRAHAARISPDDRKCRIMQIGEAA